MWWVWIAVASADVQWQDGSGLHVVSPWNEAAQQPDTDPAVTVDVADVAMDIYPTLLHVQARWTVSGPPGPRRFAVPFHGGPRGKPIVLVGTIEGAPAEAVARAVVWFDAGTAIGGGPLSRPRVRWLADSALQALLEATDAIAAREIARARERRNRWAASGGAVAIGLVLLGLASMGSYRRTRRRP